MFDQINTRISRAFFHCIFRICIWILSSPSATVYSMLTLCYHFVTTRNISLVHLIALHRCEKLCRLKYMIAIVIEFR